jgi:IS30 family transposase
MLGLYQAWAYTIAFDYGREFAEHEQVAEAYFEHPHASWER